jgi:hypothetical protein
MRIWSTFERGERDHKNSGSVPGSPTRRCHSLAGKYDGQASMCAFKLEGPLRSTAQEKTVGVKAAPQRAA